MLVLSRMAGERIRIGDEGDEIWVSVVDLRSDRVKLTVTLPKSVSVMRGEPLKPTPENVASAPDAIEPALSHNVVAKRPEMTVTRRVGETVVRRGVVTVVVVLIAPGKVRLGIEAPKDVPVYREELLPPHQRYVGG